jgi:hypothetical protein
MGGVKWMIFGILPMMLIHFNTQYCTVSHIHVGQAMSGKWRREEFA